MKTKRVTRYIADCGRGYWNKTSCSRHKQNCKCWTNQNSKPVRLASLQNQINKL